MTRHVKPAIFFLLQTKTPLAIDTYMGIAISIETESFIRPVKKPFPTDGRRLYTSRKYSKLPWLVYELYAQRFNGFVTAINWLRSVLLQSSSQFQGCDEVSRYTRHHLASRYR